MGKRECGPPCFVLHQRDQRPQLSRPGWGIWAVGWGSGGGICLVSTLIPPLEGGLGSSHTCPTQGVLGKKEEQGRG